MINLIKNSLDELINIENPSIIIRAYSLNGNSYIEVEGNGNGIQNDIIEHIFIPFYTAKKTGSGIGLSLSRQIMNLHGGFLNFESEPGIRTIFRLQFK